MKLSSRAFNVHVTHQAMSFVQQAPTDSLVGTWHTLWPNPVLQDVTILVIVYRLPLGVAYQLQNKYYICWTLPYTCVTCNTTHLQMRVGMEFENSHQNKVLSCQNMADLLKASFFLFDCRSDNIVKYLSNWVWEWLDIFWRIWLKRK